MQKTRRTPRFPRLLSFESSLEGRLGAVSLAKNHPKHVTSGLERLNDHLVHEILNHDEHPLLRNLEHGLHTSKQGTVAALSLMEKTVLVF